MGEIPGLINNYIIEYNVFNNNNNNNNNNFILGTSRFLAAMRFNRQELPPHFGGMHSCSQPGTCNNPIPAIPPYVIRTPHIHGKPTMEETIKNANHTSVDGDTVGHHS